MTNMICTKKCILNCSFKRTHKVYGLRHYCKSKNPVIEERKLPTCHTKTQLDYYNHRTKEYEERTSITKLVGKSGKILLIS